MKSIFVRCSSSRGHLACLMLPPVRPQKKLTSLRQRRVAHSNAPACRLLCSPPRNVAAQRSASVSPLWGGAQCCDGRFIRQRRPDLYTQFRPAETCAGVALFITKKKPLPPYRLRDEAAASRGESAFGGGTGAASNPS